MLISGIIPFCQVNFNCVASICTVSVRIYTVYFHASSVTVFDVIIYCLTLWSHLNG